MEEPHSAAIRVILIGSRTLIRSGLGALLRGQPHIRLTGEFAAPPDRTFGDVFIWDVGAEQPHPPPIPFIAPLAGPDHARAWLDAGASGLVLETSPLEELLDAIRQVARGETYLPRDLAQDFVASLAFTEISHNTPIEPLTDREREVVRLLAQGLSNKDIAQRLHLNVRTVEGHLANVYGKLQVKSRTEAALWAVQNL